MDNLKEKREKLFAALDQAIKKSDQALHLFFLKNEHRKVRINFVNKVPKAQLSPEQIEKFKGIDQEAIKDKLLNKGAKDSYRYAFNGISKAIRSNGQASLNAVCGGFFGPVYQDERQTMNFNAFTYLSFNRRELLNLPLAEELRQSIEEIADDFIPVNDLLEVSVPQPETYTAQNEFLEEGEEYSDVLTSSRNIIFFGPPGTGKSYQIEENAKNIQVKPDNIVRTVFYPEYSYYDFVGQYRPITGYEVVSNKVSDLSGQVLKDREGGFKKPFVYYDFVPGPLIKAIIKALSLLDQGSSENVLLVIEEINRGNCATIFGDIFQLLDRINDVNDDNFGQSRYQIDLPNEMLNFIKADLAWNADQWHQKYPNGFSLPSNLFIYATMNTSDQSLYPIDTAFKRRWTMEYVSIDYETSELSDLMLPTPYGDIKWLDFIKVINKKIVQYSRTDDKQIGQWFIDGGLNQGKFKGKILSYLWFDIFRHDPQVIFKENILTYDLLVEKYDTGVLKSEIMEEMKL